MTTHAGYYEARDAIYQCLVRIPATQDHDPYPQRTLHLERKSARSAEEGHDEAREICAAKPVFECLSDAHCRTW